MRKKEVTPKTVLHDIQSSLDILTSIQDRWDASDDLQATLKSVLKLEIDRVRRISNDLKKISQSDSPSQTELTL